MKTETFQCITILSSQAVKISGARQQSKRALRPLATLSYSSDAINYSTIVSTIEFDKDEEFFAIAGVTKRIKVFEYEAVVRDAVDVHYPCAEMQCAHKISCVSWNAYHKVV
ncbi:E3 ubiquitin-protein ligase COP1-like [Leguminivora glycinivorella]|uniref:E3 ubiquitin-protein ligase COP1-like n=1 Tax=Leguminivora glycinivorella TaxID=1035111 RepID=UPI00200C9486|nr:E3 ubiquitin-protein ligase COP1-like [Leguminivora glycinivorella]